MPIRPRKPAAAAASVSLALCVAVLATGCGGGGGGGGERSAETRGAAGAAGAASSTPAPAAASASAPTGSTSGSPAAAPSSNPVTSGGTSAPVPQAGGGGRTAPAGGEGTARTAAVKPESVEKLPGQKSFGWKPDGPLSSQEIKGRKITLNECAAIAGATLWQQQGYLSPAKNPAGQQLFAFPDTTAAQAAYRSLVADMDRCQDSSRKAQATGGVSQDATVAATATAQDSAAWSRRWTGAGGLSAPERQTNHLYAVQRGELIALFQFDELADRPGPAYDIASDGQVLASLAELAVQR
ncbi:sensor domain-containing protein [Streptomyces sp. NPDC004244]